MAGFAPLVFFFEALDIEEGTITASGSLAFDFLVDLAFGAGASSTGFGVFVFFETAEAASSVAVTR